MNLPFPALTRAAFTLFAWLSCPLPAVEASPAPALMLCYHRFGAEKASDQYQISLERFDEQLVWLASNAPGKVEISIDDGYASGFDVAPLLEKHGFRATYFVYPSAIGKKKWLKWAQLKELEQRGHKVASHSLTHPNLAKPLKGESAAAFSTRVAHELSGSKRQLETGLGHGVSTFAYPYGLYDPWVEAQVRAAGYEAAYTVSGGAALPGDPPLRLRRFLLMGQPSLQTFQRQIQRQFAPRQAVEGVEEGGLFVEGAVPAFLVQVPGFHFFKSGASQFLYHVVRQDQAAYFELNDR